MRIPTTILFMSVLFLSAFPFNAWAGDSISARRNDSPFSVSLELATKYMWRAIEYGDAPTTFAIVNYVHKGFSVYAEGVYAVNGSHSEVDLGASYSCKWLSAGINDYYYPSSVGEKDKYFKLSSRKTGHYLEGVVTISPEKIPLWLTLSTYFWGADKKPSNGKNAYSSYAELGYRHPFNGDNAASIVVGAALNKGFYTDYEHGFNVVNITAKYETSFRLGTFRLPVSASYIVNPYRNKSYVTLSIYLNSKP